MWPRANVLENLDAQQWGTHPLRDPSRLVVP
jgi:hypothetical protein